MTLRIGTLGAGYFAQFHLNSWLRMEGAKLVAIADNDITKAQAFDVAAYDALDPMLANETLDVLDIAVPPPAHATAIRAALAAGIKHIICQKPFCTSLDEARAVTAETEAAGATLLVHENFRFQPWYRTIKAALNAGKIGTPHQMTFRLRTADGQGADAYLDRQPYFQTMERLLIHETGVHYIDTFSYLFGTPNAIYADLRRMNPVIVGEDAGYFITDHADGVRCLFDGNRLLDHSADNHRLTLGEALIEGTTGTLTLTGDGAVTHRAFETQMTTTELAPNTLPGFGGDCVHAFQTHAVAVFTQNTPPETKASDYLKVIEIEKLAYASASQGRKLDVT